MPIVTTYPGVYIEELPSPVRTIVGVATSITAFVGTALKGPIDRAELIHSFPDYYRIYGDVWSGSNMSYAVYQYFLNGGQDAVILRIAGAGRAPASVDVKDQNAQHVLFTLKASSPGTWANNKLKISIDTDDINKNGDNTVFKLIVNLWNDATPSQIIQNEVFPNLSTDLKSPRIVTTVLAQESQLVVVDGTVQQQGQPGSTKDPQTKKDIPLSLTSGVDGSAPTFNEFKGSPGDPQNSNVPKTGKYLLDDVDIFNMLCIPPFEADQNNNPKDDTSAAIYSDALTYFTDRKRRAIIIVDPPIEWNNKDVPQDPTNGVDGSAGLVPDRSAGQNAAIFFPRILAADPNLEGRLRKFVPCGAIAGVIATTDTNRGIWKAPAGIEATLAGVSDLSVHLTDSENGELNPLGINCLRIMPGGIGRVVWGSRTMRGADRLADQWKYLPVRRTALYIEESLYRGTQWVVFEPNDYRLWSQIRLNVGDFMQDLFRQGAFQGSDPKKAYFVKCDETTTTQYDIDRGIVNIVVGFAPLKPAEFVILQIQQIASQEEGA